MLLSVCVCVCVWVGVCVCVCVFDVWGLRGVGAENCYIGILMIKVRFWGILYRLYLYNIFLYGTLKNSVDNSSSLYMKRPEGLFAIAPRLG